MTAWALAYLISLGIIGAGFGWIAVAHSALIITLSVLTIAVKSGFNTEEAAM
jgi:hypothetical protein